MYKLHINEWEKRIRRDNAKEIDKNEDGHTKERTNGRNRKRVSRRERGLLTNDEDD